MFVCLLARRSLPRPKRELRAERRFGAGRRGLFIEGYDLEHLQFPEQLIKGEELYTSIGVTHYKPEGAAWAQTVVLVLMISND